MPATQYPNAILESSTTTGLASIVLGGVVAGYLPFSGCGDGWTGKVTIQGVDASGVPVSPTQLEICQGTYVAGTNSITRGTVETSSNANAHVSFTAVKLYVMAEVSGAQLDALCTTTSATSLAAAALAAAQASSLQTANALSELSGVASTARSNIGAGTGSGTVTAVSVATANGVSGSSSGGATPALTIALGAITPSTVNGNTVTAGTGTLTLSTFTLTVSATASISGTNTGDSTAINQVLTGYTSGAGTVAATDTLLQAIQKLNGNDATNANLTGPITSTGNATAIAAQTGTGTTFVMQASPTLTTPTFTTSITGPLWKPVSDSTTALILANAAGTAVMTVDTTNGFIGIGKTPAATYIIDVTKSVNNVSRFANTNSNSGSAAQATLELTNNSGNGIQIGMTSSGFSGGYGAGAGFLQCNAGNLYLKGIGSGNGVIVAQSHAASVGLQVIGIVSQTADAVQVQDSTGAVKASINKDGVLRQAGSVRLTGDVTNATTTMGNLSDLTITLIAGRKYRFELHLFVVDSTAVDGVKVDFDGGAATMTSFRAQGIAFDTALLLSQQTTAIATDFTIATVTGDAEIIIDGAFVCNAAGTFIPRAAQNAHSVGTLTVYTNSFMVVEETAN